MRDPLELANRRFIRPECLLDVDSFTRFLLLNVSRVKSRNLAGNTGRTLHDTEYTKTFVGKKLHPPFRACEHLKYFIPLDRFCIPANQHPLLEAQVKPYSLNPLLKSARAFVSRQLASALSGAKVPSTNTPTKTTGIALVHCN